MACQMLAAVRVLLASAEIFMAHLLDEMLFNDFIVLIK
uniref:Uncharacterized protein n=1 Tax=Curvibacter symbiont subsp. Hydra magnipapillata TaxID=667019 RepID=C9YH79_CURXX|nr:hypothetical protein Csp_B21290 [Curvibacter putative symbiont of Hydra magnipapillata]